MDKSDLPPVPTSQPPKSSSDVLQTSIASMATISNVNIDLPLQQDEDVMKRPLQRPPPVASRHNMTGEPASHSVNKKSKARGKPPLSPPPPPVEPPLKAGSGVGGRGGDKRTAANGCLDIQPQATLNPRETVSVIEEKQMSGVDCKDDTIELLREADVQNPNLNNTGGALDANTDHQNNTLTLIKQAPTHPHTSDIQVSVQINQKHIIFVNCHFFIDFIHVFEGHPGSY